MTRRQFPAILCLTQWKGRGNALFQNKSHINNFLFVPGGQGEEEKYKGGTMDMFSKHVDYNDLNAFEAASMAFVAVLAVANGVVYAAGLIA